MNRQIFLWAFLLFSIFQSCEIIDQKGSNQNLEKNKRTEKAVSQNTPNIYPVATFERNLNIFALLSNDSTVQLTFNGSDSLPFLLNKKPDVVFVREREISGFKSYAIMFVNVFSLEESIITDRKPYQDGNDGSNHILNIRQQSIVDNGQSIMFITEKYATGDQLVKVNISSGVWTELFAADWYEKLNSNKFKNHYLIGKSMIGKDGRDIYYRLVDEAGELVKEFKNKESMNTFKKSVQ